MGGCREKGKLERRKGAKPDHFLDADLTCHFTDTLQANTPEQTVASAAAAAAEPMSGRRSRHLGRAESAGAGAANTGDNGDLLDDIDSDEDECW